MARIRYLKPDFFKDDDLVEHPFWIRLLFAGLWNIADKEGRLEDRPKRIKVDVFPYDNVDIEKGLIELSKIKNHSPRPFIQRYEVNGERYIQIINWHKHQKPHHTEQESKIPPYIPPVMEKGMGMEKQNEASVKLENGEATVKTPLSLKKENTTVAKSATIEARDYFYLKYKEKTGNNYIADFAKDGKIFKELLKAIELKPLKEVINKFFNSDDEFIIKKTGFTTGAFRTQINKLQTLKTEPKKYTLGGPETRELK